MSWVWSRWRALRILDRASVTPKEVGAIMRLFGEFTLLIKGFDYKSRNIICFMGDRTALDPKLQKLMNELAGLRLQDRPDHQHRHQLRRTA